MVSINGEIAKRTRSSVPGPKRRRIIELSLNLCGIRATRGTLLPCTTTTPSSSVISPKPGRSNCACAASTPAVMAERVRLVGINHVALAVGDLEAALAFYGSVFDIRLRGRAPGMAFVDMGDQFIALAEGRVQD